MEKTVIIYEHGINSSPSSWRDWTNRAIQWTVTETGLAADSLEYFTTALTVWCREKARSEALGHKILWYTKRGWRVHLVGHSNGTRVILEALRWAGWPAVGNVHLVCGACDGNFARNGLNFALGDGKIREVTCWTAGRDWALPLENTLLGKFLFQMNEADRPLGLAGPQNVSQSLAGRVHWITGGPWKEYGHSGCWLPANFVDTMRGFVRFIGK